MGLAVNSRRLLFTLVVLFALLLSLSGTAAAQDAPPPDDQSTVLDVTDEPTSVPEATESTTDEPAPSESEEETPPAVETEVIAEQPPSEPTEEAAEGNDPAEPTNEVESNAVTAALDDATPEAVVPEPAAAEEDETASAAGQEIGSFTVTAVDEQDNPFTGEVCFETYVDAGAGTLGDVVLGEFCNTPNGAGQLLGRNDPPGDYVLVVIGVPAGFGAPANTLFTVVANQDTPVEIVIPAVGEDAPGTLILSKVDNLQEPLVGSCFQLFTDVDDAIGEPVGDRVCDDDDGEFVFADLAPGDYRAKEVVSPVGFGRVGGAAPFTILPGQVTRLTVTNVPGDDRATFVLTAFTTSGEPLEGACFEVYEDAGDGELGELIVGGTDLCSTADGHVLSRFQDPGSYVAVAVTTPDGFATPANVRFAVFEREDTDVRVEFAPPDDPDDGEDNGGGEVPDDTDTDDETADVTALPNTGTGRPGTMTTSLLLAIAVTTALAGLAAGRPRRRVS